MTIDQSTADAGTIVVIETGGTQLSFNYTGNLSGDQFAPPAPDSGGGTDLVLTVNAPVDTWNIVREATV